MFKSTNGGTSWINIGGNAFANLQPVWLGLLAIDPVTPTRLYGGGSDGKVYSYTDDAASVTQAACPTQPTQAPQPTPPPSQPNGSSSGGGGVIDPALLLLALFGSYALARRRSVGAA